MLSSSMVRATHLAPGFAHAAPMLLSLSLPSPPDFLDFLDFFLCFLCFLCFFLSMCLLGRPEGTRTHARISTTSPSDRVSDSGNHGRHGAMSSRQRRTRGPNGPRSLSLLLLRCLRFSLLCALCRARWLFLSCLLACAGIAFQRVLIAATVPSACTAIDQREQMSQLTHTPTATLP